MKITLEGAANKVSHIRHAYYKKIQYLPMWFS